jgi:TonB family protein
MKSSHRRILVSIGLATVLISCLAAPTPSLADDSRKVKQQVAPVYPELAKQNHITGSVKLEVVITPQGGVRTVKVLGGNPVLADSAERAVKNWKFETGTEETRTITVDFKQ